jgi:nucleoside-diphosphate-sugar epimerase
MKRILIVGSGDIARRMIPRLAKSSRVYAMVRNPGYCEELRELGAIPVIGDLDDRKSLARIANIADLVLHLAPPAQQGSVDMRTRNLLSVLSQGEIQRFVYVSTSGVYGDCGGERVSETRPLKPASMRSKLRADAERQIRNWARRRGVNASILRVPGIYAEDRLPVERLKLGTPCIADSEDSHTNHIHADDLARIIVAALHGASPCRIYHASDDSQLKMGEYFDAVADAFDLPRPPRLKRQEVKDAVSPLMYSFMSESRRLSNTRMKKELRVRLRYPTVADFLEKLDPQITQIRAD